MRVIEQSATWFQQPATDALQKLELCGRVCYKSENKITDTSAADFIRQKILAFQHESVIEHIIASIRFITDRGVSHEIVRHRIASISQESTRYCNYAPGGRIGVMTVILPVWFRGVPKNDTPPQTDLERQYAFWYKAMAHAENYYDGMIAAGAKAQEARSVLPNSLKTELIMTANLREWRHFFKLRTSQAAHPQMRDLALQALALFKEAVPVLFDEYGKPETAGAA